MIRTTIFSVLALLVLQSSTIAQPSTYKKTQMGNGLTVILQEDHSVELVGLDVWVKAGSAMETPATNGVSHLIEHLAFGSTGKHKAGEIDLEMESLGATLDARTSRDWAHFSTTVSSRYLPKALNILSEIVTSAQFDQKELDRERLVVADEIAKKETKPMEVCKDYLAKQLYQEHPYSLPIEGSEDNINKITRQQVLDQYHKLYTAPNMAIVMVGDFDSQQALAEIGKAFQSLPSTPIQEAKVADVAPPASQVNKTFKTSYKSDYLGIAFLGPSGEKYSDVCAIDLLLTYLGFGNRNWMNDELVKKMGLATEASSDFLTQKYPAMISLIAAVDSANLDKTKNAIFNQIAQVSQQGIPDGSLALAKRELLGEYAFQNETFGGRANTAGFYFSVSDPQFADRYIECIQSVTNDDLIKVAKKYLDSNRAVIVVLQADQEGAK